MGRLLMQNPYRIVTAGVETVCVESVVIDSHGDDDGPQVMVGRG